ncbi:hypothetical protein [Methylobacterium sp. SyP6R]|uniref:hypothetical protein n=1 Tax=Methylobacterium sp. SyP6R TaxID=2718876 RepID=UPI001F1D5295|nr:hypothetical protein [Methylobacterium sp. SyP6R]MCF4127623.1 hypothetical protein [Methylobacterium sp. SyP6R]
MIQRKAVAGPRRLCEAGFRIATRSIGNRMTQGHGAEAGCGALIALHIMCSSSADSSRNMTKPAAMLRRTK